MEEAPGDLAALVSNMEAVREAPMLPVECTEAAREEALPPVECTEAAREAPMPPVGAERLPAQMSEAAAGMTPAQLTD